MTQHSPLSVPAGGARGVEGAQTRTPSPLEAALAAWNSEPRLLDVHRMLMALEAYDKALAPTDDVGTTDAMPTQGGDGRCKTCGEREWLREAEYAQGRADGERAADRAAVKAWDMQATSLTSAERGRRRAMATAGLFAVIAVAELVVIGCLV